MAPLWFHLINSCEGNCICTRVPVCPTRAFSSEPMATTRMPTFAGVESAKTMFWIARFLNWVSTWTDRGGAPMPALGAACLPEMESCTAEVAVIDSVPVQQSKVKIQVHLVLKLPVLLFSLLLCTAGGIKKSRISHVQFLTPLSRKPLTESERSVRGSTGRMHDAKTPTGLAVGKLIHLIWYLSPSFESNFDTIIARCHVCDKAYFVVKKTKEKKKR